MGVRCSGQKQDREQVREQSGTSEQQGRQDAPNSVSWTRTEEETGSKVLPRARTCVASLVAQSVKNPPTMWEPWDPSLSWEDLPEETWQPTPVLLPGESPWTEEPARVQSMGSKRVGHD